jgi:hypothetical protein
VEVMTNPFMAAPARKDWEELVADVLDSVNALKDQGAVLVIFDTLIHLWAVNDENDNVQLRTALMPVRRLSTAGAAVVVVHHVGKALNGPRGGTELQGLPDQLVELELYDPNDKDNPRRWLKSHGRLGRGIKKLIELNADGSDYTVRDGAASNGQGNIWSVLSGLVPTEPPGYTAEEFRGAWPNDGVPTLSSINKSLKQHWEEAGWQRAEQGVKGGGYRYWRPEAEQNAAPP